MAAEETQSAQPASAQSEPKHTAWLETSGEKFPIQGNSSIGRSSKNLIVIESQKVSRRHALINVQNVGEFWLIDLGSSNGTFLNGRRLHQPVQLNDRDQLAIGDSSFTFLQPTEISEDYRSTFAE